MALTARGKALRWMTNHRYCTEQPPNSNQDYRKDGITAAQKRLGFWLVAKAWCGTWLCNAAMAGGVKMSAPYRWASVWFCEVDAKNKTNGFRGYIPKPARTGKHWKNVFRGDAAILFGSGVHIVMIRDCSWKYRILGLIRTDEGNTSPGSSGSQNNGGGSYPRFRRIKDIYGICLINYPG